VCECVCVKKRQTCSTIFILIIQILKKKTKHIYPIYIIIKRKKEIIYTVLDITSINSLFFFNCIKRNQTELREFGERIEINKFNCFFVNLQ
jgi:hypothetical protein